MEIRKVVTFRASSIGDALNAKYLFENIHAAYPGARYGLVVAGRSSMIRDLLAAYPWIEVIEANRRNWKGLWSLWKNFKGSDLVITPYTKPGGSFGLASKFVARLLARPGGLLGFVDTWRWNQFLYDRLVPVNPERAPRLLEQDVLVQAGIPITIEEMRLIHLPQPGLLNRLGLDGKQYLVVHLFAGAENRGISQGKRQELIHALAHVLPNTPIILTGTINERAYIEQLTLPHNAKVVAGELTVQELIALIDQSTCMVSIGTGPSHIASHLGKVLLVLVVCIGRHWCGPEQFGQNSANRIFSDIDACSDGHNFSEPVARCIEGISSEEVARAAIAYFHEQKSN